jgi:hypothetical protein
MSTFSCLRRRSMPCCTSPAGASPTRSAGRREVRCSKPGVRSSTWQRTSAAKPSTRSVADWALEAPQADPRLAPSEEMRQGRYRRRSCDRVAARSVERAQARRFVRSQHRRSSTRSSMCSACTGRRRAGAIRGADSICPAGISLGEGRADASVLPFINIPGISDVRKIHVRGH